MKTKTVWLVWLYLFLFCCIIGFIPTPPEGLKALMVLSGICFFIPGAILLAKGGRKSIGWVVAISAISLVFTTISVIINFASVLLADIWGTVFYILMGIISTPMLCCQIWVISLFGWACLMAVGIRLLRKKEK